MLENTQKNKPTTIINLFFILIYIWQLFRKSGVSLTDTKSKLSVFTFGHSLDDINTLLLQVRRRKIIEVLNLLDLHVLSLDRQLSF